MTTLSYRSSSSVNSASADTLDCPVPSGVVSGDLLVISLIRYNNTSSVSASGSLTAVASQHGLWACVTDTYYKIYDGSYSNHIMSWTGATKCLLSIHAFSGDFSTASPIGSVSNTLYSIENTTQRAASISVQSGSALVFLGQVYRTNSVTTTPATDFTEVHDSGSTTPDLWQHVAFQNNFSGSTTGDIDATISASLYGKNAIMLEILASSTAYSDDAGTLAISASFGSVDASRGYGDAAGTLAIVAAFGSVDSALGRSDTAGTMSVVAAFGSINSSGSGSDEAGEMSIYSSFGSVQSVINRADIAGTLSLVSAFGSLYDELFTIDATLGTLDIAAAFGDLETALSRVDTAGELAIAATFGDIFQFEQHEDTAGTLAIVAVFGSIESIEYNLPSLMKSSWAIYAMDAFGNDAVGKFVWERTDGDKDLTIGDGATASTFPTFTENTDHETAYYSFDGVDDYLSGWPTMPDEYTVIAALSSAYPSGQPYVQSCNDDTIKTLLSTPGAFAGNVHSILVFDWILIPEEMAFAERRMLRRLWRDTFVDPFTARLVRSGDCALCLYCEEEASRFGDYSGNAIGSTDYSTGWNSGLTFPVSGAAVVMDADAALNLDAMTIFLEAAGLDTEASAETILQNGTNYVLSIAQSGGTCTVTFNGSAFSFSASGKRTLAITAVDGEAPLFYINGQYAGEGDAVATVSPAGSGQLTVGNNTARNNPFASTLKKLSIYSRALTAAEIRAAHIMARAERPFTV